MLRNREIKLLLLTMGIISTVAIIIAAFFSYFAMGIVFITSGLLISTTLFFTRRRYAEIEKLTCYLRQISSGDYALDIRDNQEGELSILKNEIYKVNLRLAEQNTLLEQEKVRLTDAISDISHQLKTPLTSLMVMDDLLSDENLPISKRKEFTRNIHIQLERMEWLVSSLLKLAKIDAGTIQFKKEQIVVKELIQKALEPILIPMDIKEQTIFIKGEEEVAFLGDFNWTVEAIINILKNCVEHTPEGGKISIFFTENVLFTEIIIVDNGKGISKKDLPYIFKRFYKGTNASEGSIGIGLAMAQSIITAQNGDIEVQSEPEKGTCFHIKFYKKVI